MADITILNLNMLYVRYFDTVERERHLPLGTLYVTAALEDAGFEVDFRDYQMHEAEELFLAEDYDFWLRAYNDFQFEPLHEPLYFYRSHNGTLSSRKTRGIAFASEKTLKRWLSTATWLSRETRGRAYVRWGHRAYQNGVPKVGRRHLLRAILVSRRPLLFTGNRWLFIEFLFGTRTRKFLQALWKRSDGAAADTEDHSDNA